MPRICPDCGTELAQKTVGEVQIDACPKCGGMFFDDEEITRVRALGPAAYQQLEASVSPVVPPAPEQKARICPACGSAMQPYQYLYRSAVTLDSCHSCGGIWVEYGELSMMDKALAAARMSDQTDASKHASQVLVAEMGVGSDSHIEQSHGIERFFQALMQLAPPYFGVQAKDIDPLD